MKFSKNVPYQFKNNRILLIFFLSKNTNFFFVYLNKILNKKDKERLKSDKFKIEKKKKKKIKRTLNFDVKIIIRKKKKERERRI